MSTAHHRSSKRTISHSPPKKKAGTRKTSTGKTIKLVRDMTPRELAARNRAGRSVLEKHMTTVPDAYLLCFDPQIKHDWEIVNAMRVIQWKTIPGAHRKPLFLQEDFECPRCGCYKSIRYLVTARGLERDGQPHREWPDGYRRPGAPRGARPQQVVWNERARRVEKHFGAKGQHIASK